MGEKDTGRFFSDHERATIGAAVARIVPADEDPGAREACVIDYIERCLATGEAAAGVSPREKKEYANFILGATGRRTEEQQTALFELNSVGTRHQKAYREGVARLDGLARELHPPRTFCGLNEEQQDEVLSVLDERRDAFFALLITHTMEGFYGHPRHGGNRDAIGWRVLGYPGPSFPRGNEYPYGSYDASEPDDFPKKKGER